MHLVRDDVVCSISAINFEKLLEFLGFSDTLFISPIGPCTRYIPQRIL
jgi:hypothetical protein